MSSPPEPPLLDSNPKERDSETPPFGSHPPFGQETSWLTDPPMLWIFKTVLGYSYQKEKLSPGRQKKYLQDRKLQLIIFRTLFFSSILNIHTYTCTPASDQLPGNWGALKSHLCVLVTQLCPTLCDPTNCSPPGSSVHGILQARILEWIAISFSRGSSWSRDQTPGLLHCREILYHLSYGKSKSRAS